MFQAVSSASLTSFLAREENSVKQLKAAPSVEQDRQKFKTQLTKICNRRLTMVKEYRVGYMCCSCSSHCLILVQTLAGDVIKDQNDATRIGLEYLQVGANVAALKRLCAEKDVKYENAVQAFNKGCFLLDINEPLLTVSVA